MANGSNSGGERITRWFRESPFALNLGYRIEELTPDRAVVVLPFQNHLTTLEDVVHGGALAALVDATSSAAAWSGAEISEAARGATVTLSVDFMRAARGTELRAEGRVVRRGGSLCFCHVEITDGSGELVAAGRAVYKLTP
jgi:uncharacterized protein (TIGR00369 family)